MLAVNRGGRAKRPFLLLPEFAGGLRVWLSPRGEKTLDSLHASAPDWPCGLRDPKGGRLVLGTQINLLRKDAEGWRQGRSGVSFLPPFLLYR